MSNRGRTSTLVHMARSGVRVEDTPGAQERLGTTPGRAVTDRQAAALAGAQPGERVTVTRYGLEVCT